MFIQLPDLLLRKIFKNIDCVLFRDAIMNCHLLTNRETNLSSISSFSESIDYSIDLSIHCVLALLDLEQNVPFLPCFHGFASETIVKSWQCAYCKVKPLNFIL